MEASFQHLTVDAASTRAATCSSAATANPTAIPISTSTTAASTPSPAVDATATPSVDAAATTPEPLYPASILLKEDGGYYEHRENDTTAVAMTSTKHAVKVTFFLADPPAVSYFCVHGPELKQAEFSILPRVVFSEKHLVLLRFTYTVSPLSTVREVHPPQYFVYKAAHGQPSLTPIPESRQPRNKIASYPSILPYEDGNFLIADLAITPTPGHYVLHTFSSKKKEWTARPLQFQASHDTTEDLPSLPHKVIALGAGNIGWIDLWRGIIVCNVFDPEPVLHFIPLPRPEFNLRGNGDPQQIRDVTCCNGFITFVEMEHYPRHDSNIKRYFKTTKDLDTTDVLYDSELFIHSHADLLEEPLASTWKIRTCYRHTSWELWCKGHNVHVDDLLVNDPSYYMMLPELWDVSARKFTLANLITFCPTLDIHCANVVYLVSKVGDYDEKAWVVCVDLEKKAVEILEPFSAGRAMPFLACTFSGYLNKTPRSCVPEDGCGQNYPLNGYLRPGNMFQNHPNMQIAGGYTRSSYEHGNGVHPVDSYLFQPQLVVPTIVSHIAGITATNITR